jgi:hypothetical protein
MGDIYAECAVCRRSVPEHEGQHLGCSIGESRNVVNPKFRVDRFVCQKCLNKQHAKAMRLLYILFGLIGLFFAVALSAWFYYNYIKR